MTLIQDTVTSILDALEHHRQARGASYKPPTVIQLRSASLNPQASAPWIAKTIAWFLFYHVYTDLNAGCDLLFSASDSPSSSQEPKLLNPIFIDPPSIHDTDGTTPTGYNIFTDAVEGMQEPAISYSDLGMAFCEVAVRREEFWGLGVIVSTTGKVRLTWGTLVGFMGKGLVSRVWG